MLKVKEVIVVEGKYDKQQLSGFISGTIVTTSGFRIFKDKEKQTLIRRLSEEKGIVIMTDSDSAGLVIRNFLKGIVPGVLIKNCYVPQILGKEKRKSEPSKEGYLGVEGLSTEILEEALRKCGVGVGESDTNVPRVPITKSDLYELGLSGRENSSQLRRGLMADLGLPTYLSANAFLEVINSLYSREEILDKLKYL